MTNLKSWRFRLVARTHASHAWNTGSIPVGATKKANTVKASDLGTYLSHLVFFTNTSSIPVGATHFGVFFMLLWRFRLVARTHASHAWNTGSIPVGATSVRTLSGSIFFCLRASKIDKTCHSQPALCATNCCKPCRLPLSGNYPLGATSVRTPLGSIFFATLQRVLLCKSPKGLKGNTPPGVSLVKCSSVIAPSRRANHTPTFSCRPLIALSPLSCP